MFSKEKIFLNKDLKSKGEVLEFISKEALKLNVTDNQAGLLDDLWEREKSVSTGIQNGFAIPHCKSVYVKEPSIFYIRVKDEIKWETLDDSDVKYVFNLLAPKDDNNVHLMMLSKLAMCLMEEEFSQKVKGMDSEIELLEYVLAKIEEE